MSTDEKLKVKRSAFNQ